MKNMPKVQEAPNKKTSVTVERTAQVILFNRRKGETLYLLLQRPRGNWVFPGGKIEKGERMIEAARREIEEETGFVRIQFLPGYKQIIRFRYKWPPKTAGAEERLKISVVYLGRVFESRIRLSPEHKNFQWATYDNATKMLKHRNVRELLEKAQTIITHERAPRQRIVPNGI